MSYQVLARKWRPRVFREMVGQEHVLQALINALDHNRLHHAYLFTGTRGVGKTTIARILAKCLNCETGVSSEPCGQCAACREIAEGRFVDLIEVDAASRTKVEDTRELLENVQYAPTRGRYKVYLIDEVHMLSNSSFNALLKTLEEPPPHVKFLLATTDPQKLPMTILSRCLQFNLKNMNPERIVQHLKFVLEQELVPYEESALWHLGRAADGSMRDAMSLTDQAIAYGSGKITESEVSAMLGTIDQAAVYELVSALASLDGRALLAAVDKMSEQAPDYASALAEMLSVLHRIAIAQALPEAVDNSHGDRERIMGLAQRIAAEDVQLFYQTALLGRRDLPLAPDPRAGFEMVLLRMLAFKPQGVMDVPTQTLPASSAPRVSQAAPVQSAPAQPAPIAQPSVPAVEQQPVPSLSVPSQPTVSPTPVVVAPAPQPVVVPVPAPVAAAVATPVPSPQPAVAARVIADTPPFDGPYDNAPDYGDDASYDEYAQAPAYLDVPPGGDEPKKPEAPLAAPEPSALPAASQASANPSHNSPPAVAVRTLRKVAYEQAGPQDWVDIYLGLGVSGILQSTASNCQLVDRRGNEFHFVLDENNSTLYDPGHQQRLADLLSDYFVERVSVVIQPGQVTAETPALTAIRLRAERQQAAVDAIHNDPIVQQLIAHFGASIREDTIEPVIWPAAAP
ncbi:DNA polymerase III subunit gamma/tau [Cellvibrio japonicus]|uniref:DNA polymerase III subunit gamma/tau n=1 Tax=Cellvibrio japonicus (strain Ueda107) TaxID=498211 RepID=B3PKH3_CELJU|nr:DNA polymerase III subunit gamma/tau [Cellvibrio japonicus]ACE86172.1 DNA polymerase III, gamma and tau subunits [Cellvibrio japonicus Ueda107]QEI12840.1 DNA polymerase III subunit gamma/tau [Cellvibrio japonicus]QEI16414.1 DNA polymerase III subunit gamma/tau [Cellvibrio japonicus]QEI19992.1 DNA polymerase III subunit gamma/tau [Cellvibrio japonicus]